MKILIVSPKFHPVIGGGETYVLNTAKLLHQAGIDVSVAVESNNQRVMADYPFKVYEINGLSDVNLNPLTVSASLYKLIHHIIPDVIHAHGYFALLAVGLCNTHGYPIMASIHSTPVWGQRLIGGMDNFEEELCFVRNILALTQPQMITAANVVYAEAAKKVVEGKVDIKVVPYPVDINFFHRQTNSELRKQLGLTKDDYLILTPSRIIERKGIKEIVSALDNLPDNFYLCLPGATNPLDNDFWNSIKSSLLFRRVQFRVLIPKNQPLYNDMPRWYAASDIVAMPSYYEGAPVATVEAMASGKPFVGADSQGINSLIRHNENGLLVPMKSVLELADAIKILAQDKVLGEKLSKQAFNDVTPLSWGLQLPVLIETYKNIIETFKENRQHSLALLQPE